MTTNTSEKAAGATNTAALHTQTSELSVLASAAHPKATAPLPAPSPDKAAILAALAVLFDPDDVVELRALSSKGREHIDAGYFDAAHWGDLADCAVILSQSGSAVYVTLNPVEPQLLSRYANRVKQFAKLTTTDKQVTRRRWLLIDLDPVRPSGTSATEPQLEEVKAKAHQIYAYLASIGWPAPVTALSGNGCHLLYAIDLPNDEASTALVKAVLLALAGRFDDAQTKVDRSVFNAARICKLYGTVANKGDHTASAPWRLSRLFNTPARSVVTLSQLAMVDPQALKAGTAAAPSVGALPTATTTPTGGSFNLEDFLAQHGMAYSSDQHEGRERFKLAACPFNPEHVNGQAAVFRKPSGELGFKCQHDSCASNHWKQVRELLDDPQHAATNSAANSGVTTAAVGQMTTQIFDLTTATLSEDIQRLRGALALIPASARLEKHVAEEVIGMALRHSSSGIDEGVGRALCAEWDGLAGGVALSVFDKSDPHYSAVKPLGLLSVFKLARESGWVDASPWPALESLVRQTAPQDYPLDALPEVVRCAVQEVAGFVKAPVALIASSALAALSLAIQAHIDVVGTCQ